MASLERIKFRNIVLLGLGFLFIYTAYQTTAATGDTVLKSYNRDHVSSGQIDGEIGMALNYAGTTVMAVFVPGLLLFTSSQDLGRFISILILILFCTIQREKYWLLSAA